MYWKTAAQLYSPCFASVCDFALMCWQWTSTQEMAHMMVSPFSPELLFRTMRKIKHSSIHVMALSFLSSRILVAWKKKNMKAMTWDTTFLYLWCLAAIKFCMIFNSVNLIFWTLRLNRLVKEQQVTQTSALPRDCCLTPQQKIRICTIKYLNFYWF